MQEVTLPQVLEARENRVALQRQLLQQHAVPLICFTMNIAGPVKVSPLIERAFYEGVRLLDEALADLPVRHREITVAATGCQAMLAVDTTAATLKAVCTALEEGSLLGRLFDMDVLDTDGHKLSRVTERGCLVCGKPGRTCAAGRLHSVEQLQAATATLITEHFFPTDVERIARIARESLLAEVYTTPKPGLVDRRNNGSHTDMTVATFEKSAHALTPYFRHCVELGHQTANASPSETFQQLRTSGMQAEQTMYRATDGINTHKGAIFSFGVLCGALGRLWRAERPTVDLAALLSECAAMTREAVHRDFEATNTTTAGGRLYRELGLVGIRGEVASGFPSVRAIGLPLYSRARARGLDHNDAGVLTLLHLIAAVQDTNLYHRGGAEGAAFAKESAKALLARTELPSSEDIDRLDDAFIARRLSPGGCADLLAVTYFLSRIGMAEGSSGTEQHESPPNITDAGLVSSRV